MNSSSEEVNGNHTPVDKDANVEDESLSEDSEYRTNVEEDEGDGSGDRDLSSSSNSLSVSSGSITKELLVKHPLQHRWTLWYDNPGKKTTSNSWADFLQKVTSFDTVEDFWRVFNNIKPASALTSGSNYHLFKDPIEPKWEDVQNAKGGRWTVPIPVKSKNAIDQIWLYALLACIGETFECTDDVCGIVVSVRKVQDRLCLWTKDSKNEYNVLQLGRQLKKVCELTDSTTLGYQSHEEASKPRSASRNRFEV